MASTGQIRCDTGFSAVARPAGSPGEPPTNPRLRFASPRSGVWTFDAVWRAPAGHLARSPGLTRFSASTPGDAIISILSFAPQRGAKTPTAEQTNVSLKILDNT